MSKTKLLFSFAAIVCLLAISAGTAFAEFRSANGHTTGKAQLTGKANLSVAPGAPVVECGELANGVWTIQERTKQAPTTKGAHEAFSGQFTKCVTNAGEGGQFATTVNAGCVLQIAQVGSSGNNVTGAVTSNCIVTITIAEGLSCIVTIPTKANGSLTKAEATVSETKNVIVKAAIGGITNTLSAGCETAGIKNGSGNAGSFTGTLIAHEQVIV